MKLASGMTARFRHTWRMKFRLTMICRVTFLLNKQDRSRDGRPYHSSEREISIHCCQTVTYSDIQRSQTCNHAPPVLDSV